MGVGGLADGHCVVTECSLHRNRQKHVMLYEPSTVMIQLERAIGRAASSMNLTVTSRTRGALAEEHLGSVGGAKKRLPAPPPPAI